MALKDLAQQLRSKLRLDSFENILTGMGSRSRDKRTHHVITPRRNLSPQELDWLYHCDDMAARVVNAVVESSLMLSYEVSEDDEGRIRDQRRVWDLDSKVELAAKWGRLFGGAAIWIGTEAGGNQDEPLTIEQLSVGSVQFLMVLEGPNDMSPASYYSDPMHPKFGEPDAYYVSRSNAEGVMVSGAARVHESRLVFFKGATTSHRQKQYNNGWDHSVLQRPYEILRDVDANWKSFTRMMDDGSQSVYKIHGLVDMIAEGSGDDMQTRMGMVEMSRSQLNAVLLDAEMEDFQQLASPNFSGASAALDKSWDRLSAAIPMPRSILIGDSATGLNANASAEADARKWGNTVSTYRRDSLEPALRTLTKVIAANAGIAIDDEPGIEWPSLWQPTPPEEAAHRLVVAQRDAVYESLGVLSTEDIARARWESGQYSDGGEADVVDFNALAKAQAELDLTPLPAPPSNGFPPQSNEEDEE